MIFFFYNRLGSLVRSRKFKNLVKIICGAAGGAVRGGLFTLVTLKSLKVLI